MPDGKYGSLIPNTNGSFNGLIGELQKGHADASFMAQVISKDRANAAQMGIPYYAAM